MYNLHVITRFAKLVNWFQRCPRLLLAGLLIVGGLAGCAVAPIVPTADVLLAVPAGIEADALSAAAAAYQQETGLRVQVKVTGIDTYLDALEGSLLAGRADYDLVYLPASRLSRWVDYHALLPLPGTGSSIIDNAELARSLQPWITNLTYSDQIYGFPVQPAVEGIWYRADLLAEAGLQPPTTWDSFRAAALALTHAPERYGVALAAGENSPGIEFGAVLAGFGGQIFRPQQGDPRSMEVTLAQPAAQQALAFYASLWADPPLAPPEALSAGRAGALNALQTGRVAMAILPLTAAADLFDCEASPAVCMPSDQGLVESRLAFAPLPGLPAGQAVGELGAWVIPLHAAHPQSAQDFGAWLVGPVGARVWVMNGGIPAMPGLLRDPQVAVKAPYLAILDEVEMYRLPYPSVRTAEQVEIALQAGIQAAAAGRLDVPSAVDGMVLQLKRALHQADYLVK